MVSKCCFGPLVALLLLGSAAGADDAPPSQQPLRTEGKIQVSVNQHRVKLEKDTLYEVNVIGQDFRADFKIDKAFFFYRPITSRIADDAIRGVQGYVLVKENKEYSYMVWPKSFPNMPKAKEFGYQTTFTPRPFAAKPFFFQEAELTTRDPLHKTLDSKHKAFPLPLQPEQTAVIRVQYLNPTLNPIITFDPKKFGNRSNLQSEERKTFWILYFNSSKEENVVQLVVASRDDENLGKFTVTAWAAK